MSLDVVMHAITYMHFLFLIVLGIWSYNAQLSQPQALVGAILSGSLQAIHGTAGLAPKVELQESFPETQPTNARTEPSQGRRQLPWDTWKNDDMTALPVAHVVINGMPWIRDWTWLEHLNVLMAELAVMSSMVWTTPADWCRMRRRLQCRWRRTKPSHECWHRDAAGSLGSGDIGRRGVQSAFRQGWEGQPTEFSNILFSRAGLHPNLQESFPNTLQEAPGAW